MCTVVTAEPGHAFAFEVRSLGGRISRWKYDFREVPEGTEVVETWVDLRSGAHGLFLSLLALPLIGVRDRHQHNRQTMRKTLDQLRISLEKAKKAG